MRNYRKMLIAACAILVSFAFLTGCAAASGVSDSSVNISVQTGSESFDSVSAEVTLSDDGTEVNGSGVSIDGNVVTFTKSGDYIISGKLSEGQLVVDTKESEQVRLILNGATVKSSSTTPLYVKKSSKTVIYLADGSENLLMDGEEYSDDSDDKADACIYSKSDLVFEGSGTLNVVGNYNHGIHSKDTIEINGGILNVTSANDGIKGKDAVTITGGTVIVVSEGDGINANNSDDENTGSVTIGGGNISVTTGGGAANAKSKSDSFFNFWDSSKSSDSDDDNTSCKGIKAAQDIVISGGNLTLDCCDDAIHSNGTASITGGEFYISTGDDGIHADDLLTLDGGTCTISKSYEGLEGMSVTINGGEWNVTASDDGINAAGGSDSESSGGRMQDMFNANDNNNIEINGGTIYVNAAGDGVDSNGYITMNGGELYVDGPEDNGNGAIDYEGSLTANGGTIVAAGYSGMAQTPSSDSPQNTLAVVFTSTQSGGELTLKDSSGNEIISFSPAKKYNSVVFCTAGLVSGSEVTLYKDGEALFTVTLSDTVTVVNDSGKSTSIGTMNPGGGMGGGFGGGFGGGKDGGKGGGKSSSNAFDQDGGDGGFDPGSFDGEMPENFEMPDGFEFNGEMPDGGQSNFDGGDMPQIPDGIQGDSEEA